MDGGFNRATRKFKKVTLTPPASGTTAIEIIDPATGTASWSLTGAGTAATVGAQVVDVASTAAFAVGPNGATNPTLLVDTNTASAATGLEITGAAAAGGVDLSVISSGTNEALTINAKGSGTIGIGPTSTGAVTITPATAITGALNFKRQVTDTGGAFATPIVLTSAQSGRVILLDDAAGLDFTLPALAAADIGTNFTFFLTTEVTSNSYRITAAAGDLLNGHIIMYDKDLAEGSTEAIQQIFQANGSSHLVITIAGADDTTGSLIGGWLELTAISATGWFVRGSLIGDGALATPFS